jgi:hypothetical protein
METLIPPRSILSVERRSSTILDQSRFDKVMNPGQIYEFYVKPNWLDATLTVIPPNPFLNVATEVPRGLRLPILAQFGHRLTKKLDFGVKNHGSEQANGGQAVAEHAVQRSID